MSFNDLERGANPPQSGNRDAGLNGQQYSRGSQRALGRTGQARGPLPLYHAPRSESISSSSSNAVNDTPGNADFKSLADRIGIQIFKLNSNVQGIEKLVELQLRKMRGAKQRNPDQSSAAAAGDKDWTAQIHDLTEATRILVKDLTSSIKTLTAFQQNQLAPTDRLTLSKLQREFEFAINGFAAAQRESAKLSRTMLDGAKQEREKTLQKQAASNAASSSNKVAVDESLVQVGDSHEVGTDAQQTQEQLQKQAEPTQAEIEFQETLIAERESEIREIENGIQELNEIFRDLGHIVQEQGGMIDNIEYNVQSISTNTGAADRELISASDYQRRAGRRAACLLLIVGFVIAIVLLAILS